MSDTFPADPQPALWPASWRAENRANKIGVTLVCLALGLVSGYFVVDGLSTGEPGLVYPVCGAGLFLSLALLSYVSRVRVRTRRGRFARLETDEDGDGQLVIPNSRLAFLAEVSCFATLGLFFGTLAYAAVAHLFEEPTILTGIGALLMLLALSWAIVWWVRGLVALVLGRWRPGFVRLSPEVVHLSGAGFEAACAWSAVHVVSAVQPERTPLIVLGIDPDARGEAWFHRMPVVFFPRVSDEHLLLIDGSRLAVDPARLLRLMRRCHDDPSAREQLITEAALNELRR